MMPQASRNTTAKTKLILDFGTFLHKIFLKSVEDDDDTIFCDKLPSINRHINYILEAPSDPLLDDQELLDSIGTNLWNVYYLRLLKVALATARGCLDVDQLSLCLKILGKAAAREEVLSKRNQGSSTPDGSICKSSTEYYILRMVLSWRQDQMEITEHMFSKIDVEYLKHDPTMAERCAGVTYDIGKSMIIRGEHSSAACWLQRSYEALPQPEIGRIGENRRELQFAVLLARVRANMFLQHEHGETIVSSLLDILEQEYGNRLPVILLNLDVISKSPSPDSQRYYANILKQLLIQRLVLHNDIFILEKCFVTFVWMQTALSELTAGLNSLLGLIEKLEESLRKPFSEEAAQASLILLWKKTNIAYERKEYDVAEKWCLLARHMMLPDAPAQGLGLSLDRKMILCALGKVDASKARQLFDDMPEASRSESLTQYLLYKVALLDKDTQLAMECLETLSKQGTGSEKYILACLAETRHIEDKYQEVIALRILLDILDKKSLDGIHLPALLRHTIRLLVSEVSSSDQSIQLEVIENTCNVFEIATAKAIEYCDQENGSPFSISEMEWFSRNSYNLAVKYCTIWDIRPVLSLVNTSIKADYYLDSRNYIQFFRDVFNCETKNLEVADRNDLLQKHRTLLAFDFEAAVRLRQWESLSEIIEESESFADDVLYGTFSDAMLCSEAPLENAARVLQQITTNIARHGEVRDTTKLSRWIRCQFQLSLDSNVEMAESVLEQAYVLARESHSRSEKGEHRDLHRPAISSSCYPEEELEWLSTTVFNRAVDFYTKPDDTSCRRWAQKSLDLAGLMHDGGLLYKVLKDRFEGLRWQ
ncbi:predicted protein [Histoplasma mississippiense (nom. inval.)]|uniref:predicted protein n=1 Tax=Ajellomyces capsulatus (strain NAm1 / WU24) TaxID=2059318 RepID=UPI000157C3AB|nr:predicted protein [Histoplasma mississippiense (nom. inval.)]EDN07288.1 predicted protein [Histoplasma mississippiense (nom. inval.)]